jgi:ATP-dependent Lon protease
MGERLLHHDQRKRTHTGSAARHSRPPGGDVAAHQIVVPVLPLVGNVVLPRSIHPLSLRGEQASRLIEAVQQGAGVVALFQQKASSAAEPGLSDLYAVGTLASVSGVHREAGGAIDFEAQGIVPVKLLEVKQWDPYVSAEVLVMADQVQADVETTSLVGEVREAYQAILARDPGPSPDLPGTDAGQYR